MTGGKRHIGTARRMPPVIDRGLNTQGLRVRFFYHPSAGTVSPPARVASRPSIVGSAPARSVRTEPSAMQTLTPVMCGPAKPEITIRAGTVVDVVAHGLDPPASASIRVVEAPSAMSAI